MTAWCAPERRRAQGDRVVSRKGPSLGEPHRGRGPLLQDLGDKPVEDGDGHADRPGARRADGEACASRSDGYVLETRPGHRRRHRGADPTPAFRRSGSSASNTTRVSAGCCRKRFPKVQRHSGRCARSRRSAWRVPRCAVLGRAVGHSASSICPRRSGALSRKRCSTAWCPAESCRSFPTPSRRRRKRSPAGSRCDKSKWVTANFPPGRAWIYRRPLTASTPTNALHLAPLADHERIGDQLERRGVDVALAARSAAGRNARRSLRIRPAFLSTATLPFTSSLAPPEKEASASCRPPSRS